MDDQFLKLFDWITHLLQRKRGDLFKSGSPEQAVLDEFQKGWGHRDTMELLKGLTENHGPVAAPTVEHFLASCIKEDWAEMGSKEAHPGTEIQDFIRILWEPLRTEGFSFTQKEVEGRVEFCVGKCPVFELAERTGMHTWLYHLACATDFYTTLAFSPRMEFSRTKTLLEGHDCCNHTYSYKSE
jgi:predicted ArsR family transcriptional regulator